MPDLDGLAFLKRVRESFESLPFVLFTGEGSESIASRAIAAGVTDYLQKRGNDRYDLLENRIKNAVESNRAKQEAERERQLREWILDSIPVGIVGHDRAGDVLFLNDSATGILAAPTDELDGRAYPDAGWALVAEDGTRIDDEELPYRRVVDSAETLEAERYLLRTSDGRERPLVVYGSPMWDNAGNVNGAVIAFYPGEG
jgi:PAS domain S-box-containing protein